MTIRIKWKWADGDAFERDFVDFAKPSGAVMAWIAAEEISAGATDNLEYFSWERIND